MSFYSRCYSNYGRICSRIHFFSYDLQCANEVGFSDLSEENKKSLIFNEKKNKCVASDKAVENVISEDFDHTIISQGNYLGFMVIRPIPITFIAKLCLKPYKTDNLITRKYEVSLFGTKLNIDTVAFQEQDRVVSACATSALWSMYHAHLNFPYKFIPSASSITKSAIEKTGTDMGEGLNPEKILQQIKSNNLQPYFISLKSDEKHETLRTTIKIIIDSKLPVILGVDVINQENNATIGKHALTVLDYEEKDDKITSIFAHDDRYGPYIKIDFVVDGLQNILKISEANNEIYKPLMLIYAFYPKVHIPFTFLKDTYKSLVSAINLFYTENEISDNVKGFLLDVNAIFVNEEKMKWNIKLWNINDLKELFKHITPIEQRIKLLTTNFPKYVWGVTASCDTNKIYFLFDATDIQQGNSFISIVYSDEKTKELFDGYLTIFFRHYLFLHTSREPLFELPKNAIWEIAQRAHESNDYYDYLDSKFGICHFPNRIKDEEISGGDLIDTLIFRSISDAAKDSFLDADLFTEKGWKYIWIIDKEGYFCISVEEIKGVGHPTLTNGRPGRIGGELYCENAIWKVNPFSGRYSEEYSLEEKEKYVNNVIELRLKYIFPGIKFIQDSSK